jgi:hypothetical protein
MRHLSAVRRTVIACVPALVVACGGSQAVPTAPSAPTVPTTPGTVTATPNDLVFIADAGVRMTSAGIPSAGMDEAGTFYLYYEDSTTHRQMVATSANGLSFGTGSIVTDSNRTADPRRTLLPDGTWRLYQWNPGMRVMTSLRSTDGVSFTPESGTRYALAPNDNGTLGVYEAFTESNEVVLLYLGDLMGANNLRRATSSDGGTTFTFDRANVLGDAAAGGGPVVSIPRPLVHLVIVLAGALVSGTAGSTRPIGPTPLDTRRNPRRASHAITTECETSSAE